MFRPIRVTQAAAMQTVARREAKGADSGGFDRVVAGARAGAPAAAGRAKAGRQSAGLSMLHAQRLAHFAPIIKDCAVRHGVPVELVCGVIIQESGGNPRAKSHAGASGLMQLMPATARRMGVQNIWDPAQNIEGGVKYLRYLLDYFKGDVRLAVAGYNAGEGNVKKYGGIPPFRETQNYVPSVLSHTQSVATILGGGQPARTLMRGMVQQTLPRHAIANFIPATPPPPSLQSIGHRLARI